jgi:hypothetical protein
MNMCQPTNLLHTAACGRALAVRPGGWLVTQPVPGWRLLMAHAAFLVVVAEDLGEGVDRPLGAPH